MSDDQGFRFHVLALLACYTTLGSDIIAIIPTDSDSEVDSDSEIGRA